MRKLYDELMAAVLRPPLHPLMFGHGESLLGGLVMDDQSSVWKTIAEGGCEPQSLPDERAVKTSKNLSDGA
jgi:hypothetical protein